MASATVGDAPRTATSAFATFDSIPFVNSAADTGCVDQDGVLHARAIDWYPGAPGSPLALNGDSRQVIATDPFQRSVQAAVAASLSGFERTDGFDYRRTPDGCVTHRYGMFERGDDEVIVSVWRNESAADPFWIPNEGAFSAVDDTTMVSDGPHISVVLMVAADGTTVRVSSYGSHGRDLVAGWPSTVTLDPARQPGASPYRSSDLIPIARAVLTDVIEQRNK